MGTGWWIGVGVLDIVRRPTALNEGGSQLELMNMNHLDGDMQLTIGYTFRFALIFSVVAPGTGQ